MEFMRICQAFTVAGAVSADALRASAFAKALRRTGKYTYGTSVAIWAVGHQALASASKSVQGSRTMIFDGLSLTGLTAVRFTGMTGWFFDN